jgi:hypothetical protein
MSDDIAFKIQLGLILPKLKDKISGDMSAIIEELAEIVKAGSLGEGNVPMDAVKEIIMKDLEIFLDESILPDIDKKLNPPEEETAETEEKAEESEGGEEEDQEKE